MFNKEAVTLKLTVPFQFLYYMLDCIIGITFELIKSCGYELVMNT